MNNFYDIIGAICVKILNMDFKLIVNNILNVVITGNMNANNFASNEEMRIYGGGCRNCPSRMPSNHTYPKIDPEEERNLWLIILVAFMLFPCLGCIFLSCRICYFVCKERVCNCCDKNETNTEYIITANI